MATLKHKDIAYDLPKCNVSKRGEGACPTFFYFLDSGLRK